MTFAVHAAPPPGEWINDPNGLVFADGRWWLFVQHSTTPPDFAGIGWARLSSTDLLNWTWHGSAIPPDALGQAYSGCVVREAEGLSAYLTRAGETRQQQVQLTSGDDGATWRQGSPFGPAGRNVRDPFVFFCATTDDWRMLIAEPCDWDDWANEASSTLGIWRRKGESWSFVGRIGPWMEPGVMWEVPVLLDFGETQVLIVSTVDRRSDGSNCAVRYWLGQFDGSAFHPSTVIEGTLLDHGPDFYAAIADTTGSELWTERILVAWASNWATARTMPWPGGIGGGPMTLPRQVTLDTMQGRLIQAPIAGSQPAFSQTWDGRNALTVEVGGKDAALSITLDRAGLGVRRRGLSGLLDWARRDADALIESGPQTLDVFIDAGLVEVFVRPAGLTVTAFLPGAACQDN